MCKGLRIKVEDEAMDYLGPYQYLCAKNRDKYLEFYDMCKNTRILAVGKSTIPSTVQLIAAEHKRISFLRSVDCAFSDWNKGKESFFYLAIFIYPSYVTPNGMMM